MAHVAPSSAYVGAARQPDPVRRRVRGPGRADRGRFGHRRRAHHGVPRSPLRHPDHQVETARDVTHPSQHSPTGGEPVIVEPGREDDLPAIADILNYTIMNSNATLATQPVTLA